MTTAEKFPGDSKPQVDAPVRAAITPFHPQPSRWLSREEDRRMDGTATCQAFPGGDVTDLADAALEAFTAGWVLAGAPLDERYTLRALAAVATALDCPADPGVLEVTLKIGQLQGAWAKVFGRREKLTAERTAAIIAIWRKMMGRLSLRAAIARWWRTASLSAADGQKAMTRADATQAATGWLRGIADTEGFPKLQAELTDALAASMAEGKAGALAVAAEQHGTAGASYSFDAAYKDYYARLADLPQLPLMAQEWVQRIIGGAANDVGRTLSNLAMDGAGADEMASAVEDLLGAEVTGAVALFTDWAMGSAMAQAALSLYASEGAQQIAFLTAGDERVCYRCEQNEAQGPYSPAQFPEIPVHPRCRCSPSPVDPLPISAFADYLNLIP